MTARDCLRTIRGDAFLRPMLASYEAARKCCAGKEVLDFGCGYGWGSFLLSASCAHVRGYDPDGDRILFARETFRRGNLVFGSDESELSVSGYDVICAFQVAAYTENPKTFFDSLLPRLNSGGSLLCSVKASDCETLQLLEALSAERGLRPLRRKQRRLSNVDSVVELWFSLPPEGENTDEKI